MFSTTRWLLSPLTPVPGPKKMNDGDTNLRPNRIWFICLRIVFAALCLAVLAANTFAAAPSEKVVYSFLGAPDGASPANGLVADAAGNLYGTTQSGGTAACQCGTVFELVPPVLAGDSWAETVIYSFQGGNDATPNGTLVFDKSGNLYGVAFGEYSQVTGGIHGEVFELSPPASLAAAWTETVLWAVDASNVNSGGQPIGKLAMDPAGNIYGIDGFGGGPAFYGVAYELVAPKISGGSWTKRILHYFNFANGDVDPLAGMLLRDGVLYGTTLQGPVFQLVRKPGEWTETLLASVGTVGSRAGLIADSAGNLFGVDSAGGACVCGTVFELSPPATPSDSWQLSTLYTFTNTADGEYPTSALWRDNSGDLFGITAKYGKNGGVGSVFKIKPPASPGGAWTYALVYGFPPKTGSARFPSGELILQNGALYGVTSAGGTTGNGTVYSVTP